jgi:hypothetical protein
LSPTVHFKFTACLSDQPSQIYTSVTKHTPWGASTLGILTHSPLGQSTFTTGVYKV